MFKQKHIAQKMGISQSYSITIILNIPVNPYHTIPSCSGH